MNRLKAQAALLLVTGIWGASFSLMKNTIEMIPAVAFLAARFITAAIAMVLIYKKQLAGVKKSSVISGIVLGVLLYAGMALQVYSLHFTTASNSAFFTGLCFVFVPLLSAMFLKTKPARGLTLGVLASLLGLFILNGGFTPSANLGNLMAAGCALVFAIQLILADKFLKNDTYIVLSTIQIATAATLFGITWAITGQGAVNFAQGSVLFTIFFTALPCTAIAYTILIRAQRNASPANTAVILAAEPVFATIFAMLIPNAQGVTESFAFYQLIGSALMFLGMALSSLSSEGGKSYKSS